MKLRSFIVVPVFALLSLAACSSGTSGGGGGGSLACVQNVGGVESCTLYKGFTSDEQSSLNSSCTSTSGGSVESSCPTANLLGCCTSSVSGYTAESCSYGSADGGGLGETASQEESSCKTISGTWSTSQ